MEEIERIQQKHIYETQVFFVENLGFVEQTAARTINMEEALKFETMHREAYEKFGYECVSIPAGSVQERVETLLSSLWIQSLLL